MKRHKSILTSLIIIMTSPLYAGHNECYKLQNNPLYKYTGGVEKGNSGLCCYKGWLTIPGASVARYNEDCGGTSQSCNYSWKTRDYEVNTQSGEVMYTSDWSTPTMYSETATVWNGDRCDPDSTYTPNGWYDYLL